MFAATTSTTSAGGPFTYFSMVLIAAVRHDFTHTHTQYTPVGLLVLLFLLYLTIYKKLFLLLILEKVCLAVRFRTVLEVVEVFIYTIYKYFKYFIYIFYLFIYCFKKRTIIIIKEGGNKRTKIITIIMNNT